MSDLSKELLTRADLIFGKIADATSQAGTFAMEQLPDIATQFILYSRVYYTVWFVIAILLCVLAVWMTKKWWDSSEGAVMLFALWPLLGGIVLFVYSTSPMLMSWLAPKIFLITEIVKLVKS